MWTHIDKNNQPSMVDVSNKNITLREAMAEATIQLPTQIMAELNDGEIHTKKGPVFQTAIIAGVMAMKKTSDIIPFCHPLSLEGCKIDIKIVNKNKVRIQSTAKLHNRTGVEMEALTGASVAALTIYDMCKALSHDMEISGIRLIKKRGGKSDINQ